MTVKTVFNFIWGGEPKRETYTDVVKITNIHSNEDNCYTDAILHFKDGKTTEICFSIMRVFEE